MVDHHGNATPDGTGSAKAPDHKDIPGTPFLAGGAPVAAKGAPVAGIRVAGARSGDLDEKDARAGAAVLGRRDIHGAIPRLTTEVVPGPGGAVPAAGAPRRTRGRPPARAGQEGFAAETAVAVTVLSHSANSPSESATWCAPAPGSPTTSVG